MTVHMIRVITSTAGDYSLGGVNAAMDDWVSKQSAWTSDPDRNQIREYDSDPRGISALPYRAGDYRFRLSDEKENLLQKCEDKLENKVAWYRLGHHTCQHDEENPGPCQWGDQREWTAKGVTIPDGIPTFSDATP